ncbi:MAG: nucleotidyltransferase family protein [Candidatus Latescibacterota bacterium]
MPVKTVSHNCVLFHGTVLAAFCREKGIARLSLFGSVLRGDFGPGSDIDMLIEFLPGERVGLLRLMRIERELADLLGVLKVDLRLPDAFDPILLERINSQAETLYVHG